MFLQVLRVTSASVSSHLSDSKDRVRDDSRSGVAR